MLFHLLRAVDNLKDYMTSLMCYAGWNLFWKLAIMNYCLQDLYRLIKLPLIHLFYFSFYTKGTFMGTKINCICCWLKLLMSSKISHCAFTFFYKYLCAVSATALRRLLQNHDRKKIQGDTLYMPSSTPFLPIIAQRSQPWCTTMIFSLINGNTVWVFVQFSYPYKQECKELALWANICGTHKDCLH